jgi:DNA polymerase-3 subunit alpha
VTFPPRCRERLAFELNVIADMGFSSYFLIVWDLIRHARDSGIRVGPARQRGPAAPVAYCLQITDLDPIRYDLLFERFLNPSPHLDARHRHGLRLAFRDEMIRYAAERYGATTSPRSSRSPPSRPEPRCATRPACSATRTPRRPVSQGMPPSGMGRDTPLYACFEPTPSNEERLQGGAELRAKYDADPDVQRVSTWPKASRAAPPGPIHAAAS